MTRRHNTQTNVFKNFVGIFLVVDESGIHHSKTQVWSFLDTDLGTENFYNI